MNRSEATTPPALAPGTFSSVLPTVEDILGLIYRLSEGDASATTDDIVVKAKAISSQLAAMRSAASTLPGGHLGTDAVVELTRILEEQAQSKRATLQAFCDTSARIVEAEGERDGAVSPGA